MSREVSPVLNPVDRLAKGLTLPLASVKATVALLKDGATVPFIARYRKEVTGSLDEVAIASIRDGLERIEELDARRTTILKSLAERNLLTPELEKSLLQAETLTAVEDLYLPFRPKKRTRATIAKEQGLEPLADLLLAQRSDLRPLEEAAKFVEAAKGIQPPPEPPLTSAEQALAGARDILAERINDSKEARERLRSLYQSEAILHSRVLSKKEEEGAKYKDYFDWREPASKAPSHRILAIFRGEKEGFLAYKIAPEEAAAIGRLEPLFLKAGRNPSIDQVQLAIADSYKRLLGPAMESELRNLLKDKADQEAIRVFAENLRELLMTAPLGQKRVLAIDPGFRTGCKVVLLDAQGKLLHHDVVYPEQGAKRASEAGEKIRAFIQHFKVEAIAVGNGTAGRETERFLRDLGLPASIAIIMVNESGASIYSASDVAREEFPDLDLTVRGAVSIGRRLMDPLAELVKIDPKSIGVGQYQHDVDQSALKKSLDDVVMSSVNRVGVELNTASKQLLSYVSGIGNTLAENIILHRNENGPFRTRKELLKVARLGPKAFEQAAGFLRIHDAENPLDRSAVHPESYPIVDRMAKDLGCKVDDLIRDEALRKKIVLQNYISDKVGLPTLNDIISELAKPGRDPRAQFEAFAFAEGINQPSDLKVGMRLPGIVTNVAAFGAFVDIGVHQDGLVHISQLSDTFVKNPADVVKVQQKVMVTVVEVDLARKRIALSMKSGNAPQRSSDRPTRPENRSDSQNNNRNNNRPSRPNPPRRQDPPQDDWFTAAMRKK